MQRSEMLKKIKGIDNLPTLPLIALSVNRMLQDYESPMERLVEMLEKDQALVLKLLRLVNSSFFGFKSKVNSLRHAVTLLGYSTVQNAVITVSVIDTVSLKNELKGFDITRFWEHSIHVAVLSKYLAVKTRLAPPEDAFTAGLLHDIGKVVLANFFPDVLIHILDTIVANQLSFHDAEQQLDLLSHSAIGSHLAHRWMLPEAMVAGIKLHHAIPKQGPHSALAGLVSVSGNIVHMMSGDAGYKMRLDDLPEEVKSSMLVHLKTDNGWFKEVKQDMNNACDFFKQG